MKLKFWVWKLLVAIAFSISFVFLTFQFPSESSYFYLFNTGFYLLLLGVILILIPKWDLLSVLIYSIAFSFYTWGQSVYVRAFDQLAFINTAFSLKNEATKSFSSIFEFLRTSDFAFLIIPLISVVLLVISIKVKVSDSRNRKLYKLTLVIPIIISLIFIFLSFQSIHNSRTKEEDFFYYKTDHYLFNSKPSSLLFVEKFGLNLWFFKDIYDVYLLPTLSNRDSKIEEISEYINNDFAEKLSTYNSIFKDKSLLLIEAESLNNYAIDPVLTPTLYRLLVNGYHFPNYNSPLLLGSTSDAELMVNTGLLPPENGYVTFLKYFDNVFPTTLAKEFNEEGYYSIASHNNYGEFYNRDVVYPNFGYTFFDCIDMGFDTQFIDDSKYIEILTWILVEKPQFLSYWITFNGHQPYNNIDELSDSIKTHLETVKETYPDIPSGEQVFLAKNMDLDRGLAYMLEVFTYMNRIEDLVIVIYGDHAPKGIFEQGITGSKDCTSIGYTDEQCLNTPLIVWHNDSFVGESPKVANPTDISPTIYDLFGIDYNQVNVFGNTVYSNEYNGFYFDANGNIKTDNFTFDSKFNELKEINEIHDIDLDLELKNKIDEMNIYRKIIETDYFAYVESLKE